VVVSGSVMVTRLPLRFRLVVLPARLSALVYIQ